MTRIKRLAIVALLLGGFALSATPAMAAGPVRRWVAYRVAPRPSVYVAAPATSVMVVPTYPRFGYVFPLRRPTTVIVH